MSNSISRIQDIIIVCKCYDKIEMFIIIYVFIKNLFYGVAVPFVAVSCLTMSCLAFD